MAIEAVYSENVGWKRWEFGIVTVCLSPSGAWEVYLPHSCDEWVIGRSPEEVQKMIDELSAANEFLRSQVTPSVPGGPRESAKR